MLKLTLSPTAKDLDRVLEAAYKSFYQILEEASSSGRLVVRVYPNLDSIVAGAVVASLALRAGVRTSLRMSLEPSQYVDEPTVAIGYNKLEYKTSDVSSGLLAVCSGSIKSIPVHRVTFIDGQGSNTALVALVATSGIAAVSQELASMAMIGAYAGGFVDPVGRFSGLDRLLLERLSASVSGFDVVTTLKVYKPHVLDLCEALARTAHPLYLGVAGNPWRCQDILGAERFRSIAGKPLSSIGDSREVEQIAKSILEYLVLNFKSKITAKDIVAGMVVYKGREAGVQDFREALDALIHVSDVEMSLGRAVATLLDIQVELPIAESRLESSAKTLADVTLSGALTRLGATQRFKVYAVGGKPAVSLTLLWRAMRIHGFIEPDSILVVEENGELLASPIQIEEALGYGAIRELVENGLADFDGDRVWVERKAIGAK